MIVGLTGGIATGKSTVARVFEKNGWRVIDADQVAKQVRDHDPAVRDSLRQHFGNQVFHGPLLDIRRLGKLVFADQAAMQVLNGVLQPRIRQAIVNRIHQAGSDRLVLDLPLLFEQHYQPLCDQVVVVFTELTTQRQRLMKRNQLPFQQAQQRIAAQQSLASKVAHADWAIDNNGQPRQAVLQATWLSTYLTSKTRS